MQKIALFLLSAAAAVSIAPCANAQALPGPSFAASKSEAILGAPSSLGAIMAAQASGRPAAFAPASLVPAAFATTVFASNRPAASLLVRQAPYVAVRRDPAPVSQSRPDVFNSVALEVGRTSLDARWAAVARAHVGGNAARFSAAMRGKDEYQRIEAINTYVNANVTFVDDRVRFGVADRWAAPAQTLASGRGDCEDYAIAKLAMLRAAGFADRDLYLVILKDLVRRADHAVLVVRSGGRFLVLDNGTDRLTDSADIKDYRPILTFSAGHAFTHGYRRDPDSAPIQYAMVESPRAPVPAAAMAPVAPQPVLQPEADPVMSLSIASADFPLLPAAMTLALLR